MIRRVCRQLWNRRARQESSTGLIHTTLHALCGLDRGQALSSSRCHRSRPFTSATLPNGSPVILERPRRMPYGVRPGRARKPFAVAFCAVGHRTQYKVDRVRATIIGRALAGAEWAARSGTGCHRSGVSGAVARPARHGTCSRLSRDGAATVTLAPIHRGYGTVGADPSSTSAEPSSGKLLR
jgi:hypothetical protein